MNLLSKDVNPINPLLGSGPERRFAKNIPARQDAHGLRGTQRQLGPCRWSPSENVHDSAPRAVDIEAAQGKPVPIALDESAYTLADEGNIVRQGAADVVLLDPHEIGGLWQTIKAAAIAEAAGIPVTLHSGGELGFSQSAYIHLAASISNMSISIDSERAYLSDDVVVDPPVVQHGAFEVSDKPGLGVDPDFAKLEKFSVSEIQGAYLDAQRPGWFPLKPAY